MQYRTKLLVEDVQEDTPGEESALNMKLNLVKHIFNARRVPEQRLQ